MVPAASSTYHSIIAHAQGAEPASAWGTRSQRRIGACLAALLVAVPAFAQPPKQAPLKLQPFDYRGVTLDDGPLKRQFDQVRDDYLRIPNDDLLKGFRARAGEPAPGVDLGGWYTDDVFHVFGQILSGLARMHAATGDTACLDKARALLDGWEACIAPDGYFMYSAKPNVNHYVYDKMVGGLTDMILYAHSSTAQRALERITAWAQKHLDRTRPYGADGAEWYTLSENLYRAYLATGDARYRDFAKVWEYTDYWSIYARGGDILGPRPDGKRTGGYHAYSHVNTLGGAGAAYLVAGEKHYLDTLRNAYDYLQAHQCFATGGYGPDEGLKPLPGLLQGLSETHNTFETQCGSWAAFKMCRYLQTATGEARYGDWVERLVINGIGASIPMSADGHVFYYSDYNVHGASKQNIGFGWSCCTGTRPIAVADYHNLIYYRGADGLYVNLYTPSTVRWEQGETPVTVTQRTRFPEEEVTELTVSPRTPATFCIGLRVPGWVFGSVTVTVNDVPAAASRDRRGWLVVRRIWRNGDRLRARFPMRFWVSRMDPDKPYPCALLRGPVVLAVRSDGRNPAARLDLVDLGRGWAPVPGEPLTYHVAGHNELLVRPFYAFKEGEPYYLYLDPEAGTQIGFRQVSFAGPWNQGTQFRFSNAVGATAECAFTGTAVRWLGFRFDDGGRAEVRIDGQVVATVSQYGPGRDLPFDWRHTGLAPGKHTIKLTLLEEEDAASKDRYLNVAGFEVVEGQAGEH